MAAHPVLTRNPRTSARVGAEPIIGDAEISSSRRPAIGSAVNTLCRILAMQPETVPASLGFIRRRLGAVSPAAVGVNQKRLSTVKAFKVAFSRVCPAEDSVMGMICFPARPGFAA
jgi:hypothetical protein